MMSSLTSTSIAAIIVVVALSTTHVQAQASTCGPLSTINSCLNNPSYKCYWCTASSTCASSNTGGCVSSSCNSTALAYCTTTANCGWCNSTMAGFNSNCQYSSTGTMPTASCSSNWTPYYSLSCSAYLTQDLCLDKPGTCYWCGGSYCTSSYSSSCVSSSCANAYYQSTCTTSSSYQTCGWCASPFSGYGGCQFSSSTTQTAACYSGWTPNGASICQTLMSLNECMNTPTYTCYWCGSYCTSTYNSTCTTNSYCVSSASYQSTCLSTSSYYSSCGWCVSPVTGFSKCLFSGNGSQPSACNSSWTPNPSVTCGQWTTQNSCMNFPNYTCYWCGAGYCTGTYSSNCSSNSNCKSSGTYQSYCLSTSTSYSQCGWCTAPASGGFANCQFSVNGSITSSCNGTWTPNPALSCGQWTTQNSCLNYPNYTCYWCGGGSFCTGTYNSLCYSNTNCKNAYQYSCTGTSSYYAACGWCAQPAPGYSSNCLFASNGTQPSACASGWTVNVASSCSQMTTPNSCFNNPNYTSCYWCGTFCSSASTALNCFSSSCSGAYSYSCTSYSSSAYANCGWCTNPVGINYCLYGANGNQPSACLSGWTANTAATPACVAYSSQSACTSSASYCGWCSVPLGTYGNCQTGSSYKPSSCVSGWTYQGYTYAPYIAPYVAPSVSWNAWLWPVIITLIVLAVIFVVIRRRVASGGSFCGSSNFSMPRMQMPNFGGSAASGTAEVMSTPSRPAPHGFYEAYPPLLPSADQAAAPPPLIRTGPVIPNSLI